MITFFRADKTDNDGFWTKKKKYISEKRFVICYTYEKPNPVQLGTYDAVVPILVACCSKICKKSAI